MFEQHRIINCLLDLIALLIITLLLTGCGGSTPASTSTPEAVAVAATPVVAILKNPNITEVPSGGQVVISAEASGINLAFQWKVDRGKLSKAEGTSTIYTAPDEPGLDTVDVIITSDGGSTTKTVTFTVMKAPTEPTEAPMEEPMQELTEEPTITITIAEPKRDVECRTAAACRFMVKGTSTGIAGNSTYKIVPFVNPSPGAPDQWWPQFDRPLGTDISEDDSWQAEAQIGTKEGEEPGHHFEVVALVMGAAEQIPVEFQTLPITTATSSNIVSLVTMGPPPITLVFPEDDQVVPCENVAEGMYSPDVTEPIWPVVLIGGKYHPQDEGGKAPPKFDGEWHGTVRFGDCKKPDIDRGKLFHLLVVTADEQCNEAFEGYLSESRATGSWPGMDNLPEGCTQHIHITVTRE